MNALVKIGFYIGYVYAKLFIVPFPKRRARYLKRLNAYTDAD